ncbi:ABC transporter ATP-binding protein [Roseibium sp. Sym1]|uniref:ABC transporter ATP-binding protein n=1 Tax=Roseibium sp. Sym1 TaxID=3016006 RepID=UPI0022B2EEA8|nr:ABC transporter ATP-binding protein [Roseibium sp. Sym1]
MSGLSVSGISYSYGAKRALDNVSFRAEPGRFCALLGPNGAGKSTLFGLLTHLFTTSKGRIRVAGHDLAETPRKALAEIGVVFQQTTLDLDLTVKNNLQYFAALHGLSGRQAGMPIDRALECLGMRERADERARDLNGGHRRRAEIARALIHGPSVLLLDEPTAGLDTASRASLTDHVHDLSASDGLTVLWATHLTDEVRAHDQLVILHQGHILADGVASDLTGDRSLPDYFLQVTAAPES